MNEEKLVELCFRRLSEADGQTFSAYDHEASRKALLQKIQATKQTHDVQTEDRPLLPPSEHISSEDRLALAAGESQVIGDSLESVRPLTRVRLPGEYWNSSVPTWDELGLQAELVIRGVEVLVRWHKPEVQGDLDLELWSIAAELLREPDDRPQGASGRFATRGRVQTRILGSEQVQPDQIRLLAVHVFGPDRSHLGCVVLSPV